jgi:hypothetical protein
MITPREFAFATPADLGSRANYRRFCKLTGLPDVPDGYGLLLADDESGARFTLATADVEYVRMLAEAASTPELLANLELPSGKFMTQAGWPDDWT